jgi:predicted DNA-binding ribbon-helix-helix protein
MEHKQQLPIGIQTFAKIREEGMLYIDKTRLIYNIIQEGEVFFLSRPRRFGKSLLISTFKSLFEGQKELFDGLWIADQWDWTQTNPVIYIPFNAFTLKGHSLATVLVDCMHNAAKEHDIVLNGERHGELFRELIEQLHAKTGRKVVVLIDEYDKPIIDFLNDPSVAQTNRDVLKSFYGVLKPADPYLRFVLLTGVSKFAKVSIFSDLNNLQDISLHPRFATLLGFTQTEVETHFAEEIEQIAADRNLSTEELLAMIRHWYNGYNFNGKERVYNPFSLLRYFATGDGQFTNYWFETGTPTFLVNEVKKHRLFDFTKSLVSSSTMSSFNYENLNPYSLLFQTGYLTIESYSDEDGLYTLTYPNEEVRRALTESLLMGYREAESDEILPTVVAMRNALREGDIAEVVDLLNTVFSTLPYDLWQANNERFYHALVHLTFVLLGTYIQSEMHSSRGRCDALVQTKDTVYAFEFKLDKTAQEALQQIEDRGYLTPFAQSTKTRMAVGINFSTELKAVESWVTKVVNG